MPRAVEDWLRQDQAIGHDYRRVGLKREEALLSFRALQARRRAHFEAEFFAGPVRRRFAHSHAASGRAWRLSVDGGDLVPGLADGAESRHGEIGRAHENDAHGLLVARLATREKER